MLSVPPEAGGMVVERGDAFGMVGLPVMVGVPEVGVGAVFACATCKPVFTAAAVPVDAVWAKAGAAASNAVIATEPASRLRSGGKSSLCGPKGSDRLL